MNEPALPRLELAPADLGELLARGRTAEVYALDKDRVLKLLNTGVSIHEAELETQANLAVEAAGIHAPTLLALAAVDDRHGMIFSRLQGELLIDRIDKSPDAIDAIALVLAELHAAMHRHTAPALRSVKKNVTWAIQRAPLSEMVREVALQRLAVLPDGDALCHMDFHPYQVFVTGGAENSKYAVVDWVTARRGAPAADIARTALLLSMARIDDPHLAWLNQGLYRSSLAHRYVNHYCRMTGTTVAEIEPWFYPLAAARRAEVDDDNQEMLAFLEAGVTGSDYKEFTGAAT